MTLGSEQTAVRLVREREKLELRRERDRVVLDLARDLGTDGLAACLGTTVSVADTIVQRARGRMRDMRSTISARRLEPDRERWREADRHYETLGRRVRLPGER
jgi:hypothetical protein